MALFATASNARDEWTLATTEFNTQRADRLEVVRRWNRRAEAQGDAVWFAGVKLVPTATDAALVCPNAA